MSRIDLNADLGESFGHYTLGQDDLLLPLITSANIACGFHAGDPDVMARTVAAAVTHGVALGAHPGLPDLAGFGRRMMQVTPEEVVSLVIYQVGALDGFARRHGRRVAHVKPHGALYTMAERQPEIAEAIARAVHEYDKDLIVFGLAGGRLVSAAQALGLRAAHEVFADRAYESDGTLTPRTHPGALIVDPEAAAARMVRLVTQGTLEARDGTRLTLPADTVCVHGDGPEATETVKHLRRALSEQGVTVARFGEA